MIKVRMDSLEFRDEPNGRFITEHIATLIDSNTLYSKLVGLN